MELGSPEFVREARTVEGLRSLHQALISEPIRFGRSNRDQAYNFAYGETVDLSNETASVRFVTFSIPQAYHYHLEGLRVYQTPDPETGDQMPPIKFKLRRSASSTPYNDESIPFDLDTTPIPGDSIRYRIRNNITYVAQSIIILELSNYLIGTPTLPERVEIMTEGIRFPAMRGH